MHRESDPRRSAPGVLDAGGGAQGGSQNRDGRGAAAEREGEWVAVVRGGAGRRGGAVGGLGNDDGSGGGRANDTSAQRQRQPQPQQKQGPRESGQSAGTAAPAGLVEGGGEDSASGGGGGGPQAPQPKDLPPMRLVDIPTLSRRAIAKKLEVAAGSVEKLLERGAGESKVHRAREEKDRWIKELRAAGGATEKTLSFTIKGEDDRVEKAERALRKAIEDKRRKEAKIAELQAELEEDEEGISRHRQRLQKAMEYREHLATQKLAEAASDRTLQYLKVLAAAMSPQDPLQAQAQAWALRAIELGAAREEVDMACGDTESEEEEERGIEEGGSAAATSEQTRLDLSRDDPQAAEWDGKEALERRLAEARERLAAIQREQTQALGRVGGPLGGENKRNREGEQKQADGDGDVDMAPTPALTALQVVTLFGRRMLEAEEEVRQCQILLDRGDIETMEQGGEEAGNAPQRAAAPRAEPAEAGSGRTAGAENGAGAQRDSGQRGRPRSRPGYESWVTAEEHDARREEQREQQRSRAERRQPPQGPRTASREEGPARCRWAAGARLPAEWRQRSDQPRPRGGRWHEVERAFSQVRRAGDDLEGRVRDNFQIAQQERMQQLQEEERREAAAAKVAEAAMEIEARRPRDQAAVSGGGDMVAHLPPTFGPTGQRLDEQQCLLRAAAAGSVPERGEAAVRPPSVPRRRTRWGDEDSEGGEEGGRERSQRGGRATRLGRVAMES